MLNIILAQKIEITFTCTHKMKGGDVKVDISPDSIISWSSERYDSDYNNSGSYVNLKCPRCNRNHRVILNQDW